MSKVCYTLKYLKMGYRLGIVRIVGSKVHLEVISLPPSLQEGFNLERTSLNVERVHPIRLSPKLDLLVLGRFALTFGTETNELPPPIECDIELTTPARDWGTACTISSCGQLAAFDKPAYHHLQDYYDRQPGRSVMIFRINRAERTATRLRTPYPKGVQVASLNFHLSLPLATFSFWEGAGRDNNQSVSRDPRVPANELCLSMVHLNTDGLEPLQMTHRVCSKFYSADTGGFLLLEGFLELKTWPQNL